MKKLLLLMILTFIFTLTACGQDFENTEDNNSQQESEHTQLQEQDSQQQENNSQEESSENSSYNEVATFHVNNTSPKYTAGITYDNENPNSAKTLIITETESGKQLQKIDLPENDCFSKEPLYLVDINFDENFDLLIPHYASNRAVYFQGYVWNPDENNFVYAPSFENIPNFNFDNVNQLILSQYSTATTAFYTMHFYDTDKKDFVCQNSLYWEISDTDQSVHFVEEELENEVLKIISEITIESIDSFLIDESNPKISHYFAENSFWDLNSAKWEFLDADILNHN